MKWEADGMEVLDEERNFVAMTEDAGIARQIAILPELVQVLKELYPSYSDSLGELTNPLWLRAKELLNLLAR